MATRREIAEALAKEGRVERIILSVTHSRAMNADLQDLAQIVYLAILEYDEDKIIERSFLQILQRRSRNSRGTILLFTLLFCLFILVRLSDVRLLPLFIVPIICRILSILPCRTAICNNTLFLFLCLIVQSVVLRCLDC